MKTPLTKELVKAAHSAIERSKEEAHTILAYEQIGERRLDRILKSRMKKYTSTSPLTWVQNHKTVLKGGP